MQGVSAKELRAICHSLPKFRKDQKVQIEVRWCWRSSPSVCLFVCVCLWTRVCFWPVRAHVQSRVRLIHTCMHTHTHPSHPPPPPHTHTHSPTHSFTHSHRAPRPEIPPGFELWAEEGLCWGEQEQIPTLMRTHTHTHSHPHPHAPTPTHPQTHALTHPPTHSGPRALSARFLSKRRRSPSPPSRNPALVRVLDRRGSLSGGTGAITALVEGSRGISWRSSWQRGNRLTNCC